MAEDLLVKLYDISDDMIDYTKLKDNGIRIVRAMALDKSKIVEFAESNFRKSWADECEKAIFNNPISCFIAIKDKEIIGFACYDATAKGFFGPTGVSEKARGKDIGRNLLLKCLLAMKEEGYGYAIIGGGGGVADFYKKSVNALVIENSHPGIYSRMVQGGFNKNN